MKFRHFDRVRIAGTDSVGTVFEANKSVFGETYWIVWDNKKLTSMAAMTLMHGDKLEKANVDFQVEKP